MRRSGSETEIIEFVDLYFTVVTHCYGSLTLIMEGYDELNTKEGAIPSRSNFPVPAEMVQPMEAQ